MQRWMGGKRRQAAVQRRDPHVQQQQFFARKREQAVHVIDTKKNGERVKNYQTQTANIVQPGVQVFKGTDVMHSTKNRDRKRHRKPPKLSTDLLALAHLGSTDILKEALHLPRQKRHKSLNGPLVARKMQSPPEVGKLNRTVAVNAESNSVRVFEDNIEKTAKYHHPSFHLNKKELQRWPRDRHAFARDAAPVTNRSPHPVVSVQNRRRGHPVVSSADAEEFSRFSKPNTMDIENGVQSQLFLKTEEPRNLNVQRCLTPQKGPNQIRTPYLSFERQSETQQSHRSPYWSAKLEIGSEPMLRARSPAHLLPLREGPHQYWSQETPLEKRIEIQSRPPPQAPSYSEEDTTDDEDKRGGKFHLKAPASGRTEMIHFNFQKEDPMNLDDFSAETVAMEDRLFLSADITAGKFKKFYAKNRQCLPKWGKKKGLKDVRRQIPTAQRENTTEPNRDTTARGEIVNSLPRQTYFEGVQPNHKSFELREDSLVVATVTGSSPIAAASGEEKKISLLTIHSPSCAPEITRATEEAQ